MNITDYAIYGCIGNMRVSFGKWYVPMGKTAAEITYCEWCFNNGCIKNKDVGDVYESNELVECNCNCNNYHVKISRFFCNKHYNIKLITNGQKRCKTPKCGILRSNKRYNRYQGCSAIFGVCEVCG